VKGVITKVSDGGEFAFVRPDDPRRCKEAFVHSSEVVDGTALRERQRIEFDVEVPPDGRGRPIAINVSGTGNTAEIPPGRRRGTVFSFGERKQFGFIRTPGLRDIFFHLKDFEEWRAPPSVGEMVEYEAGHDDMGRPRAVRIRRLSPESQNENEGK
jgi:cold shock CspA family protein